MLPGADSGGEFSKSGGFWAVYRRARRYRHSMPTPASPTSSPSQVPPLASENRAARTRRPAGGATSVRRPDCRVLSANVAPRPAPPARAAANTCQTRRRRSGSGRQETGPRARVRSHRGLRTTARSGPLPSRLRRESARTTRRQSAAHQHRAGADRSWPSGRAQCGNQCARPLPRPRAASAGIAPVAEMFVMADGRQSRESLDSHTVRLGASPTTSRRRIAPRAAVREPSRGRSGMQALRRQHAAKLRPQRRRA